MEERSAGHRERIKTLEDDMQAVQKFISETTGSLKATVFLSSAFGGAMVAVFTVIVQHYLK